MQHGVTDEGWQHGDRGGVGGKLGAPVRPEARVLRARQSVVARVQVRDQRRDRVEVPRALRGNSERVVMAWASGRQRLAAMAVVLVLG